MQKALIRFLLILAIFINMAAVWAICGDNQVDSEEQCDLSNFNGLDCVILDEGYNSGYLACTNECKLDTSNCKREFSAPESEEETNPYKPAQNQTEQKSPSQNTGSQSNLAYCGDGIKNNEEECEAQDLNGKTCGYFGYDGGALSCTNCKFDLNKCNLAEESEEKKIANEKSELGGEGQDKSGAIKGGEFPAIDFFSAKSENAGLLPKTLAIICGIWSILMSLAAKKLTSKREEKEIKEIMKGIRK